MDITKYMSDATNRLIRNVALNSLSDAGEMLFLMKFASSAKKATKKRTDYESRGIHIPGFLISSITTSCNLNCSGCYARENGICGKGKKNEMTDAEWDSIFDQASEIGISFNILAGGEPMMRTTVIECAAKHKDIVFPIFTNGTMIEGNISLFKENRNLVPIVSIEGNKKTTDERRGDGVYDKVMSSFSALNDAGVFHGASITITTENYNEVTSQSFINLLKKSGCGIVFYIEYVPSKCDSYKAFDDSSRPRLNAIMDHIREVNRDIIFMSFPGDERLFGGCIGAGRGFFHINPFGDAEACPASPYHDRSVRDSTLADVLGSPLFARIRAEGLMEGSHTGGCTLMEKEHIIKEIVNI